MIKAPKIVPMAAIAVALALAQAPALAQSTAPAAQAPAPKTAEGPAAAPAAMTKREGQWTTDFKRTRQALARLEKDLILVQRQYQRDVEACSCTVPPKPRPPRLDAFLAKSLKEVRSLQVAP